MSAVRKSYCFRRRNSYRDSFDSSSAINCISADQGQITRVIPDRIRSIFDHYVTFTRALLTKMLFEYSTYRNIKCYSPSYFGTFQFFSTHLSAYKTQCLYYSFCKRPDNQKIPTSDNILTEFRDRRIYSNTVRQIRVAFPPQLNLLPR